MKIAYLSDLHNEYGYIYVPSEAQRTADVVVLAGDIGKHHKGAVWAKETFPNQHIVYVTGNHEYYGAKMETVDRKIMELEDDYFHPLLGSTWTHNGVKFIGTTLWTDLEFETKSGPLLAQFSIDDYRVIKLGAGRLSPEDTVRLHKEAVAFIQSEIEDGCVVVTHHAPHPGSIHRKFEGDPLNCCFCSDLTSLLLEKNYNWIHGHMHNAFNYRVGGTRVVCNPRGYVIYRESTGFDPSRIIEV